MQSLCSKLRLIARRNVNNLKNVDLKQVASVDSKYVGYPSVQCSGFDAQLSSSSAFFTNRNFCTKRGLSAFNKRDGVASVLLSYRGPPGLNQSDSSKFVVSARSMTTLGSTAQDALSSDDVPQRVKFKRLDKTARHIMQIIDKESVEEVKANREIPDIRPGYIVQLRVEVPENKRRATNIKGIVIARRNAGLNTTFRIRRLVAGVSIESLFPLYSPNIKEIKVLEKRKVRRAKLYYLRERLNALKKQ